MQASCTCTYNLFIMLKLATFYGENYPNYTHKVTLRAPGHGLHAATRPNRFLLHRRSFRNVALCNCINLYLRVKWRYQIEMTTAKDQIFNVRRIKNNTFFKSHFYNASNYFYDTHVTTIKLLHRVHPDSTDTFRKINFRNPTDTIHPPKPPPLHIRWHTFRNVLKLASGAVITYTGKHVRISRNKH